MTKLLGAAQRSFPCALCCVFVLALSALMTGCGGSKSSQVGLPSPPATTPVNSYVGSQGDSPAQQLPWSVTIDHTADTYSYSNPNSGSTTATTGAFSNLTGGFLILLDQNGYQSGLALEIPGEAIILRPGDSTAALVFAVQQASCFPIGGNVKFLFIYSPGLASTTESFFGRIYATTDTTGSSWAFNNQTEYVAPYVFEVNEGSSVPSNGVYPGYSAGFNGTCSASDGSAAITTAPPAYFQSGSVSYAVPTEYVINPAGFFFENQSYANVPSEVGWSYSAISAWGVSEPSVPTIVGVVGAEKYVGFLFETTNSNSTYRTRLVGFGNTSVSGTVVTGGTFPNDDPTQTPDANMSVTFGTEDPLNNGWYYSAKLTTPDDGTSFTDSCLTYGVNAAGTATCTNDAIATVGHVNGQYAIILSASDTSGNQETLVLFQQ